MNGGLGQFDAVYNILILVVAITLIARQINFPATIAFILAGLLAASVPRIPIPHLSPEIFLTILLPPILFTETLTTDIYGLIDDSDTILSYAIAGTILITISLSLVAKAALGLSWLESLIMGVVLAPTDPVSVISTFKQMGVIKRFQLIVSGESLFNDGVAIVAYTLILRAVQGTLTPTEILETAIVSVLGGVVIGYIAGYLVHLVMCWTEDLYVKTLLTFITGFGVFRLAEEFHTSGVIAVVISGLLLNYRSKNYGGLPPEAEEALLVIWEFVGFLASSFAFIFIGVSLDLGLLRAYALPILALGAASLLLRHAMVVAIAWYLERTRGKRIPYNWRYGMTWSGLKGAVSIVLVLGVTGLNLAQEELMLALTFGLVLLTNVVQGLTMPRLIRVLNLYSKPLETRTPENAPI